MIQACSCLLDTPLGRYFGTCSTGKAISQTLNTLDPGHAGPVETIERLHFLTGPDRLWDTPRRAGGDGDDG